jgi:hypothetical protein
MMIRQLASRGCGLSTDRYLFSPREPMIGAMRG